LYVSVSVHLACIADCCCGNNFFTYYFFIFATLFRVSLYFSMLQGLLEPLELCRISQLYVSPLPLLSKDVIEMIGVVVECFPNTTFSVRITSLEAKDHVLLCHLAGRMRVNKVRILPGDRVRLEMTPYDLQKGRIVYRFRTDDPAGYPAPLKPATPLPLVPPAPQP
jgi:translation initiation factor IF-1